MQRTLNLATVFQIVQKIPENYCPCLYLSIGQAWWLNPFMTEAVIIQKMDWFLYDNSLRHESVNECGSKDNSKMHTVSSTNTHHDVKDLVNNEMVKNTKSWISWWRNLTFLRNRKILVLCLRWHILWGYHFVAEVALKEKTEKSIFLWKSCLKLKLTVNEPSMQHLKSSERKVLNLFDF